MSLAVYFYRNTDLGNRRGLVFFVTSTATAVYGIITAVIYALRKLIAFVFLGGMFWFIYQDLDNLEQPWFMHALGLITIVFAFFWLLIPMVVVWCRIRRRCVQNRARYRQWLAEGGVANLRPRPVKNVRFAAVDPEEQVLFHEKGTLYVEAAGTNMATRPIGRPSDVAFPRCRRDFYVCQRTHCYMTNRRVVFGGKDLNVAIPWGELKSSSVTPGGVVFEGAGTTLLFTFPNPLVAADILSFAKTAGVCKNEAS